MKNLKRSSSGLKDPNTTNAVLSKHRRFKRWQSIVSILAVIVLIISAYSMILPALTMEQQTFCGQEEHVHTDACYEERLICTEPAAHTHSESCYTAVEFCTCGLEEGAEGHVHTPECYTVSQELICGIPEGETVHQHSDSCYERILNCGKNEHTHDMICYSNPAADTEDAEVWLRSVSGIELTGVWADDLVEIAKSQIGYTESSANYSVNEKGEVKGYSRYGAWYGSPYDDWSGMFVSFCMNYAGISQEMMPYDADCTARIEKLKAMGLYEEAQNAAPAKGDLVFFNPEEGSTLICRTGLVSEVKTDAEGNVKELTIIEGDADNTVRADRYDPSNNQIAGYGRLAENPVQAAVVAQEAEEDNNKTSAESEKINLVDYDLAAMTAEELNALLEKITPEQLYTYLDSLTDEEYDALMDSFSEESQEILAAFLGGQQEVLASASYVGYSKVNSDGSIDFAEGGGSGGVRKYYLAPISLYDQYKAYGTYAAHESLIGQSELAYCFNHYSTTPSHGFTTPTAYYSESQNASPALFYSATSSHRRYNDQNTLYNKVLAMAMNGYPNDYSGIGKKYGLTADEFRFITQYAIWYYTDSVSLRFTTYSGSQYSGKVFYAYADDTGTWLTKGSSGGATYNTYSNDNVRLAYQALVNSTLDPDTVNTSHINLYEKYSGTFQHLLTVGKEDAPPPQNSLKLKKTVSGNAGDTDKDFSFTIILKDQNKRALSGTYTLTVSAENGAALPSVRSLTFNTQGVATVTLKHGQGIRIEGLPDGFFYKITEEEANQDGYTTTVNGNADITSTYTGITGNAEVEFVNDKDYDAPPPELKTQIKARKTIDGGQTAIGSNRFKFRLTGPGQDVTVENDGNGDVYFPEMTFGQAGTYTYTIEELSDDRDGTTFDFDKNKKTVTITVTERDLQSFDPDAVYYAFEALDENFDSCYYVDTVIGGKGIVMYCTNQSKIGPQYTSVRPAENQTYGVVLNPTITQIVGNGMIQKNIYGDELIDRLKKLFYYFETDDAKNIANNDKQALVWTATGKTSSISYISVNGRTSSNNAATVLNNIYETVDLPAIYNLAFFIPTGSQATACPQPLAIGYGAVIESTGGEAVFDNTSKAANSLKIGKTVTGTAGDKTKLFTFNIALRDNNFKSLNGEFNVTPSSIDGVTAPEITSVTFVNGQASVQLKHGQFVTIEGLPDGFYYTVQEAEWNQDGYTSTLTSAPNNNNTGNGATGAIDVEFKNHKDAPPLSYNAEIKATKTLDGEKPADGQFTFILKKDGVEISRKTNDADGVVTFPLTFTEPGTYVYTIEELNDGQPGIVYDTEVKTVTVEVGSEALQAIVDSDMFTGSHISDDYYITVNGGTKLDVYCIDGSTGYPGGDYTNIINPSSGELAEEVTSNKYGNDLEANMRKLLYYFDTHSYTDKIGYTTLSKSYRQELIWCLTGNSYQQYWQYTNDLNTILAESNPPESYTVVMFKSTETPKKQPVIAGYMPEATVTYKGRVEDVEFNNFYDYHLPETGGIGTNRYTMGGLLLMGGAMLLLYTLKIRRKKEVKQ